MWKVHPLFEGAYEVKQCCTYGNWPRRCRPCSRGLRRTSTSCGCTLPRGTASHWPSTWPEALGDGRSERVTHPTDPAGGTEMVANQTNWLLAFHEKMDRRKAVTEALICALFNSIYK